VDTILAGFPVREVCGWAPRGLVASASALSLFLVLAHPRLVPALATLGALALFAVVGALVLFDVQRALVQVAAPLIALVLCGGLAVALRASLSPHPAPDPRDRTLQ
jgi:hypothetical protein